MNAFLRLISRPVTTVPGVVLIVLILVTALLGSRLPSLEMEVDLTEFRSDSSQSGRTMDLVEREFVDSAAALQVIIDAGPDNDILSIDGLEAITRVDQLIVDTLGDDLRTDQDGQPLIRSIAAVMDQRLAEADLSLERLTDTDINVLAGRTLTENPDLARQTSLDRDLEHGSARAVFSVAMLDADLSATERTDAAERLNNALSGDTVAETGPSSPEISVVSQTLFEQSVMDSTREEAPLLFGLALLVVLGIMGFMYRAVIDTLIGFAGLALTIIWTFGFAALMGPAYLGWTGPLSQLAILVPVLMVGLGVDYAVHLTTRYREQRTLGDSPVRAARNAIHTVGAALVLASAATVIGFAANATAPLQITADFALFVAVGIISAFLVMGFLVPSARVLLDRRELHGEEAALETVPGSLWLTGGPARLAKRFPAFGFLAALVFMSTSLVAATDLDIEFNRDDFIPSGSQAAVLQETQDALFGGQLDEVTYVVITGDFTDPALLNAIMAAEENLAGIEGVATLDGVAQTRSITTLIDTMMRSAADTDSPAHAVATSVGWDGSAFDADADLRPLYGQVRQSADPAQLGQLINDDYTMGLMQIQTTGGDAGASRILDSVEQAFAPVAAEGAEISITSEPMIMGEMSDELAGFQLQSLGVTLALVLLILGTYYRIVHRHLLLGVIAMIPALVSASLLLGTMWLLDISVNAVTATMAAIAVGIGVPYGVHVVNRFAEEMAAGHSADDASQRTLHQTGRAIVGSGFTTLGAFVVLAFANLGPIQQLGLLGAFGIVFALMSAMLVMPGALTIWGRRQTA